MADVSRGSPPLPQTQLKSTEWTKQAYAQVISEQPDLKILTDLEEEARALLNKSNAPEVCNGCRHVLALVAAARNDVEQVNELYTRLYDDTKDIQFLMQHASINIRHGQWLLARPRIDRLWQMAPDNLQLLEHIFMWSMLMGDYFRGQEVSEQLKRLNNPDRAQITSTTMAWLNLAKSGGLNRAEYIKRWEVAIETIYSAGLHPAGTATCRGRDDSLSLRFQCDATVDKLIDLDFAIAKAIVSTFDDPLSKYITFATISKRKEENNGSQTQ